MSKSHTYTHVARAASRASYSHFAASCSHRAVTVGVLLDRCHHDRCRTAPKPASTLLPLRRATLHAARNCPPGLLLPRCASGNGTCVAGSLKTCCVQGGRPGGGFLRRGVSMAGVVSMAGGVSMAGFTMSLLGPVPPAGSGGGGGAGGGHCSQSTKTLVGDARSGPVPGGQPVGIGTGGGFGTTSIPARSSPARYCLLPCLALATRSFRSCSSRAARRCRDRRHSRCSWVAFS